MKFIKQHERSTNVINLEMCRNIFTLHLRSHKDPFIIRFAYMGLEVDYESWYYEKEADRDLQFKYICEFAEVQSIGN